MRCVTSQLQNLKIRPTNCKNFYQFDRSGPYPVANRELIRQLLISQIGAKPIEGGSNIREECKR
jgi:hypothetical protein